ncbi:hypothetical protein OG216_34780 [Streptomycetaceae bacterium NBC_01309]
MRRNPPPAPAWPARVGVMLAVLAAAVAFALFGASRAHAAPPTGSDRTAAAPALLPAAPEPPPDPTATPTPSPEASNPVARPAGSGAPTAPVPRATPGTAPWDPNTNTPLTPVFNPFDPGDWIDTIGGWLSGSGGFGIPDISGLVVGAITALLGRIVEEAAQPLLDLLGKTLLVTPDPAANPSIREVWTTSLGITASVYGLFIVAGGVTVMAYESVQTRHAAKQIAPRLVVSFVAAAVSLEVMHYAVELSNAVAQTILGEGVDGAGIVARLFNPVTGGLFFLILVVVQFAVLIAVLLGFMVRVALVMLLAACAPLAIACHASPATDGLARLWWRAFGGCLAIQLAQATTLIVGIRTLYGQSGASPFGFPTAGGIGAVLAGLALFYILLKIPSWATRVIFQAVPRRSGGGMVRTVLRGLMYWRLGTAAADWWKQRQQPSGGRPGPGRGGRGPHGRGPGGGGRGGGGRGPRRGIAAGAGRPGGRPNAARPSTAGGSTGPRAGRPAPGSAPPATTGQGRAVRARRVPAAAAPPGGTGQPPPSATPPATQTARPTAAHPSPRGATAGGPVSTAPPPAAPAAPQGTSPPRHAVAPPTPVTPPAVGIRHRPPTPGGAGTSAGPPTPPDPGTPRISPPPGPIPGVVYGRRPPSAATEPPAPRTGQASHGPGAVQPTGEPTVLMPPRTIPPPPIGRESPFATRPVPGTRSGRQPRLAPPGPAPPPTAGTPVLHTAPSPISAVPTVPPTTSAPPTAAPRPVPRAIRRAPRATGRPMRLRLPLDPPDNPPPAARS